MTKDLVVREQRPYELTEKQVTIISNTEFVPQDKRGKPDVIWASIFKGRSIGIDDFTAINEIHIVNGKPGLSAALAAGIVRKRGHVIDGKLGASEAVAHGRRADNGAEMTVTFTLDDAKNAGLAGKQVWKQYPQSLLWARAVTQLCRSLFSDCFLGGVYTPEELGADYAVKDDVIDADVIEHEAGELTESGAPEQNPGDTDPGSVSPLDLLIATYGRDEVAAAYKDLFPGRGKTPLTDAEVNELTEWLSQVDALASEMNA